MTDRNFPNTDDLLAVLRDATRPMTTIEVHVEARKRIGLTAPHHHGTAGTMLRLDRLYREKSITFRRNDNGAVIWSALPERKN